MEKKQGKKEVKIADLSQKKELSKKEMEKVKGGRASSCTCAGSAKSGSMSSIEDNS